MLSKEIGKFKARMLNFGRKPKPLSVYAHENGESRFLIFAAKIPNSRSANCTIDVGGNFGEWTAEALTALQSSAFEKFVSIEPIPQFADEIEKRFSENSRVKVIRAALGREAGRMQIYRVGGGGTAYPSETNKNKTDRNDVTGKTVERFEVDIVTGDALCALRNLRPFFIKIDCDGFDCPVLEGFSATLELQRPIVQFEYSDFWLRGGYKLAEACRLLSAKGYVTYWIRPGSLQRFRFNMLHEVYGYQNIAALPEEIASRFAVTRETPLPELVPPSALLSGR